MLHDFVGFFANNIEKRSVCFISSKKNYYNLAKNNHKFQASVTERCTSLNKSSGIVRQNPLKVSVKKLDFSKNFTAREVLHMQVAFKVSSRIFLTYLQKPVYMIYGRHILHSYSFVKRISSRFYYSWDGKQKTWS